MELPHHGSHHEVAQLRQVVAELSRELLATREPLEVMRTELSNKFNNFNQPLPDLHETMTQQLLSTKQIHF